jgi:Fe-S-cluster containining protein
LSPFSCPGSTDCCHFARTGREPYPHAIEIAEIAHAVRASPPKKKKSLELVTERRCPMLDDDGRCRVYASRPFGCRTYFCEKMEGGKFPREKVQELARRVADLSVRAFPEAPGPRALTKVLRSLITTSRSVLAT